MIKVKDHNNLFRDPESKAIINVDDDAYRAYLTQKERLEQKNNKLIENTIAIETLQKDMEDIKAMLVQLLNNNINKGQ